MDDKPDQLDYVLYYALYWILNYLYPIRPSLIQNEWSNVFINLMLLDNPRLIINCLAWSKSQLPSKKSPPEPTTAKNFIISRYRRRMFKLNITNKPKQYLLAFKSPNGTHFHWGFLSNIAIQEVEEYSLGHRLNLVTLN